VGVGRRWITPRDRAGTLRRVLECPSLKEHWNTSAEEGTRVERSREGQQWNTPVLEALPELAVHGGWVENLRSSVLIII